MGGIMEPLYLNGVLCKELNFSVDPISAARVVYECKKLSILTSQCTQDAAYELQDLEAMLDQESSYMRWSKPILSDWIERKTKDYGNRPVFINWDLCTAIYLTNPELFSTGTKRVIKKKENMLCGFLELDKEGCYETHEVNLVDIPDKIIDLPAFNRKFYEMLSRMR